MRILLVGDAHGHAAAIRRAGAHAVEQECEQIVILGDTGWLFDFDVRDAMFNSPVPIDFLRGNHDCTPAIKGFSNIDDLRQPAPVEWTHSDYGETVEGVRVRYLGDYCRVTYGDTNVLVLGGAVSVDRHHRIEDISWWSDETLRPEPEWANWDDVDVVLAHDAPDSTVLDAVMASAFGSNWKRDDDSSRHRAMMNQALDLAKPRAWYHGHYHLHYKAQVLHQSCAVTGLTDSSHTKINSMIVVDF